LLLPKSVNKYNRKKSCLLYFVTLNIEQRRRRSMRGGTLKRGGRGKSKLKGREKQYDNKER